MAQPRHLPNAPIVEALIDVWVEHPPEVDIRVLEGLRPRVKGDYPRTQVRRRWTASLDFVNGGKEPASEGQVLGPDGYAFWSADEKQVLQFRLDGFTFSRLKPYQDWERFRDEASRLWELCLQVARPEAASRVALRFINRIELPLPITDFGDYLVVPPTLPEGLPQGLAGYFSRIVVVNPDTAAKGILTQAVEPLPKPTHVTLLLDVDVFREGRFSVEGDELWEFLEELRGFKNDIFFESVTDRMLELFE